MPPGGAYIDFYVCAPSLRHPSRTAGGTQTLRIIVYETAHAQGLSPGHVARRAYESIQIVQGPSSPTGNFNVHGSMGSGAHT